MATFACVSLPTQFITPPPSTSNCNQHIDSDCGSSTGTGRLRVHEVSDDGSTSSQQTPPEYPSPPPPSNSPPESMASLQAESPVDDGGPEDVEVVHTSGVKVWMAQQGYQSVPLDSPLPSHPQSILFVHVNSGEMLQLQRKTDNEIVGNLIGPGTVRMIGEPGMTNQPLPIQLRPDQQCHQFVDEEGNLRHVVLSVASPDGNENPRELNVPQIVGPKQLMNAMGGVSGNARRGGGSGARGRGSLQRNDSRYTRGNQRKQQFRGGHHHHHHHHHHHSVLNHIREEIPVLVDPVHVSLLGEPNGPSIDLTMSMPPPNYQQPCPMMVTPQKMPMQDLGMVQTTMLQDPVLPGTSVQIYGMPPTQPPPGMIMVPSSGAPFNNNKWIPYQTMEENERIREILCKALRAPTVANVLPTEVEFLWMPIKLIDWQIQTNGCIFPCLDQTDIAYHATVLDIFGKTVMTYILDVNKFGDGIVSNLFRAHSLRPNNRYDITIKAVVADRAIYGDATPLVPFRTAPGRPDPPTDVEVTSRGINYVVIAWKASVNNGAFVSVYYVYIHENEYEDGRMLQATGHEMRIAGLKPQTCYKITVSAINALGESLAGCRIDAWTKAVQAPHPPTNIVTTGISHRSVRIMWDANPNCQFWIELYDCARNVECVVRERFNGNTTILGELEPNSEYRVRVTARNEFGEAPSDWVPARTQPFRKLNNNKTFNEPVVPNYERPPSTPFFVRYVDNCPEMAWKTFGPNRNEQVHIVEGSTYEMPEKYIQLYRGSATSLIVLDHTIHYMRLYIIHKKGQRSSTTERVVIPRDYSRYRPERVSNVTLTKAGDGIVVAEWQKICRAQLQLPETALIRYYVQRSDLTDSPVTSVGEDNQCVFENVAGESTVTVRVRSAVSFHDALVHGDWSIPVSITTPRSLPPPVVNVSFATATSVLSWDCLDNSSDLQFSAEVFCGKQEDQMMKVTTESRSLVLEEVRPGEEYKVVLVSSTNVGQAVNPTTFHFEIPALKPTTPCDASLIVSQMDKCSLKWSAAEPNGSPVTGYVVKLWMAEKLLRESVVAANSDTVYRLNMKDLSENTKYVVTVAARNSIGDSEPAVINMKTQPLPPVTPELQCDCEASTLKLHWEHVTSSPSISYKIMRINNHGQQMSVYEGDNNSIKVKNLAENTDYSFQIRVTDRLTGASTCSPPFTFRTSQAPPPPVKHPLRITPIQDEPFVYFVEWRNYLTSNTSLRQFYRLQAVDATVPGAKWITMYEGDDSYFELDTEDFPGALHIRVMCVRDEGDRELKGSPSPVLYIVNDPPGAVRRRVEVVQQTQMLRDAKKFTYFFGIGLCLMCALLLSIIAPEEAINWVFGIPRNNTSGADSTKETQVQQETSPGAH